MLAAHLACAWDALKRNFDADFAGFFMVNRDGRHLRQSNRKLAFKYAAIKVLNEVADLSGCGCGVWFWVVSDMGCS